MLGGAWGGVAVGAAEAVLIAATGRPEEYWLFAFAIVYYGLVGAGIGAAVGLVVLSTFGGKTGRLLPAVAFAASFIPLAFAVGRYHVNQRLFQEQLIAASPTGMIVHVALLAAVLALGVLLGVLAGALNRKGRGQGSAAGLLLLSLGAGIAGVLSNHSDRPAVVRRSSAEAGANVVLIIADTLRADAAAARLAEDPATSGLARLARDGVVFEKAYTQSSWTRPSVATILSSLYPSQHGAIHKMDPLADEVVTLAEVLQESGYWTAGIVSNINVAPIFNFHQGFGEYEYLAPDFYFGATDSATRLAIYKGLRAVRERVFKNYIYFGNYYQDATVIARRTGEWLDQTPPEPFFLLIHYMDPHDPYFAIPYNGRGVARVTQPNPPASRAGELRSLYDQGVAYLDQHLAHLFSDLHRRALYEDSVIVLTADHGEEFQEHGGWWHGTTLYEEQLRVPLLVKRPREPKPGTVDRLFARTIDIAPTILAAAGLPASGDFAGIDLFGHGVDRSLLPLYAEESLEGNVLRSMRLGDWKLITANEGNPRGLRTLELYDLGTDPQEQRNLVEERPVEVARLLHHLEKHRRRLVR